MVDELDKSIVLFRELLMKDLVVLCPDLLHPLATHPLCYEGHLPQAEDRFVRAGAGTSSLVFGVHHGFWGSWSRAWRCWWRGGGRRTPCPSPRAAAPGTAELPPLLQPLYFVPQIVCYLLRGEGRLQEGRGGHRGAHHPLTLLRGVLPMEGHTAPALSGALRGVQGVEI